MSSKTRIVVLRMKELIYTGVFVALGILLILLLIYMFAPGSVPSGSADADSALYVPGVYASSVMLNGSAVDVAVTVNANEILSVSLVNLNETVETLYPLMEPALDELASQICSTQSLEGLTYSDGSRYTSQVLLDAVSRALSKAEVSADEAVE